MPKKMGLAENTSNMGRKMQHFFSNFHSAFGNQLLIKTSKIKIKEGAKKVAQKNFRNTGDENGPVQEVRKKQYPGFK